MQQWNAIYQYLYIPCTRVSCLRSDLDVTTQVHAKTLISLIRVNSHWNVNNYYLSYTAIIMIPITKQDDYHMRRPQVGEARTTQSYRIYMCLYSIYYILHRTLLCCRRQRWWSATRWPLLLGIGSIVRLLFMIFHEEHVKRMRLSILFNLFFIICLCRYRWFIFIRFFRLWFVYLSIVMLKCF